MLTLNLMSIFVDNPQKALLFYTSKLGFIKKKHHETINYITVGPKDSNIELILETNENSLASNYQKGLYQQGIPAATFFTDNLEEEYHRLTELAIKFTMKPTEKFDSRMVIFDDEQGNLIQIVELIG